MKRLFFLLGSMDLGGVEKAFLGHLSTLRLDQCEVHVGLLKPKGLLLPMLPKEVVVHHIDCYDPYWHLINDPPRQSVRSLARKGQLWQALVHLLLYLHYKLTGNRILFYRYILRNTPYFPVEVDEAYAFAGPSIMTDYYVCRKVRAKEKYGWIHFDVSRFGTNRHITRRLYPEYRKIYIVSREAKAVFDRLFPEFQYKTVVRPNVIPREQILLMAESGSTFEDDFPGIRLLTVGRLAPEKGQSVALEAMALLKQRQLNVRWYFVGDGRDRATLEQQTAALGVSGQVTFLGAQLNPYRFMRDCDIYVQPSRHEGFCLTVGEAKLFGRPIVATGFTGAHEQLDHYAGGMVCDMSAQALADGVQQAVMHLNGNRQGK